MDCPPIPATLNAAASRLTLLVALAGSALTLGAAPPAPAADTPTPAKGAQVYCFMRSNGNPHEVSWNAAYALIKRQSASLFKTSPEHAAVMITEAVVQNPENYPDCGRFLGDLHGAPAAGAGPSAARPLTDAGSAFSSSTAGADDGMGGMTRGERYGY
jgi:hypothetical protein